jgi:electron transfer flavoprotein beta subunit
LSVGATGRSSQTPSDARKVGVRIGVFLKVVTDPQARLELAPDGRSMIREGVALVLNESDEAALACALALASKSATELVAIALGGDGVLEPLRKALALGCDQAVRLESSEPTGGDPRGTARILAAAARRLELDLAVTGAQSSDGGSGLTGPFLAAELGWSSAWLVLDVVLAGAAIGGGKTEPGSLEVVRELENRRRERLRLPLPAVVSIQTGVHRPRMASIRGLLSAKKKSIETLSSDDLGLAGAGAGAGVAEAASALELIALHAPHRRAGAELLDGSPEAGGPEAAAASLIARLAAEGHLE